MTEQLKGTPTRLAHAAITTGPDTLFTVGGDCRAAITDIIAANTTTSTKTLTVGISGVAAANQIIPGVSIGANSMLQFRGYVILNSAETIQAGASAAGITLTISGVDRI